jgi:hypothetical protein
MIFKSERQSSHIRPGSQTTPGHGAVSDLSIDFGMPWKIRLEIVHSFPCLSDVERIQRGGMFNNQSSGK